MDKIYSLSERGKQGTKIWPIVITLCGIFLVIAFKASPFSIVFAILLIGLTWWQSGYAPHEIIITSDGIIIFRSNTKEIEVAAADIRSIIENTYYREFAVLHQGGRIAVPGRMPDVMDFIETVKGLNPSVKVKLGKRKKSAD